MTDKELRKLSRTDLLEILFYLQKEVETLRTENESLQQRLQSCSTAHLSEEQFQVFMAQVNDTLRCEVRKNMEANAE